ncbi:hypothetical protein RRG08_060862 [Elysia crispata]|uniref:Uncharacterized protein n=1 Tax=Elysia crispata TaxID=231223 RepID=A0AAE0ZFR3_9GAST|nr:hypothetical protein RRG08_060862 [Elysia crispata]
MEFKEFSAGNLVKQTNTAIEIKKERKKNGYPSQIWLRSGPLRPNLRFSALPAVLRNLFSTSPISGNLN